MRGIYPDYIGPTAEYRTASLYPSWIGAIIDQIPPLPWLGGVEVLSPTLGVAKVVSTLGMIVGGLKVSTTAILSRFDVVTTGEPGVEVKDEEPGI